MFGVRVNVFQIWFNFEGFGFLDHNMGCACVEYWS